ncbi:spore germination protein [Cytobacillus sp. FJAT-53684]|uniref:Spore germination protein n=1 Tax=Cytobacillus mangrovibacter TaxID=3299024 RepID=A0ABW6K2F3_9BACI
MIFSRHTKGKRGTNLKQQHIETSHETLISSELLDNIAKVQSIFCDAPDLIVRLLVIKQTQSQAALVYLSSVTDSKLINDQILSPLLYVDGGGDSDIGSKISLGKLEEKNTWEEIESAILQGSCLLFIDKHAVASVFNTSDFPKRSIEDTAIESALMGAHIGFTETGSQNIALIRKHIPNRELKIKEFTIGERGRTKISILFLADVVQPELLKELEDRINRIKVDEIINTGVLAEYIEDNPYSPFPQLLITERPDMAALEILEGRIVTVVDKSPSVLIGPTSFISFFKTMDDYGTRWFVASFIRLIRYFAFFVAIFLPSIYISIITFHLEVIPLKLLISIGTSRDRVPFQPFIEAVIMEVTLEMLREAGVRLPTKIGQTVGIVGGIVIGQAAVEAGIVSNIMVIIVSLTAVASFIIPNYDMGAAIRIIRFPMMFVTSVFGFIGLIAGLMVLIGHFISLQSLGTPYGSPIAPLRLSDWKDAFFRFPQWSITKRPESTRAIQQKKADFIDPKGDRK